MKGRLFVIVIISLYFASCTTYDVIQYGKVDPSVKTISMPAGGDRLVGSIKKYLVQSNWDISVYSGPEKTEVVSETESIKYDVFTTKYTCFITYKVVDFYLDGDYQYRYDITLIDNQKGKEVFTISGVGKGKEIVKRFSSLIENRYQE